MDERKVLDFLAEAGHLKRVRRSGWWLAGIPDPESVAEHVYRTAVIGHLLAKMEGADPHRVVVMILYHDLSETRLNDLHKIARRYVDLDAAEARVRSDQLAPLGQLGREVAELLEEYESRESPEATVARDADLLECILQGKEYADTGFPQAEEWYADKLDLLRTDSARRLYDRIRDWDTSRWRSDLKKLDR
jgi:putative hydrolase of HD superfamily